MVQQENKTLGEQGRDYIAQLEEEGQPFFDAEHKIKKLFSDRLKELFEKQKDNEPK